MVRGRRGRAHRREDDEPSAPPLGGAVLGSAMRHPRTAEQRPFPSAKRPTEAVPNDTVSEGVFRSPDTPGHPNMDGSVGVDRERLKAEINEGWARWPQTLSSPGPDTRLKGTSAPWRPEPCLHGAGRGQG